MPEPYLNRIIAVREILANPSSVQVQFGLELLSGLIQEHGQEREFLEELNDIIRDFPKLKTDIDALIPQVVKSDKTSVKFSSRKTISKKNKSAVPKILISYSHKDEKYKDELVTMLTPLQNKGTIEIWQDRRIEDGNEWYQAIVEAMNNCDFALLLISKNFLTSRFVNEELLDLLKRVKNKGLQVIPIILSACLWQNVPVIKDLQTIPKNGKPIISLIKTSEREEAWTQVIKAIEYRANILHTVSILFLSADPTDVSRLRIGEEMREIQEKLQLSKNRSRFKLDLRTSVRPEDISQAMLDLGPNIVHFSGHGLKTGALCFENQIGQMQAVAPDALAALFDQFDESVECVLLNACYSEKQAQAISEHIEWVIGMNDAIGDQAALSFSIGFYQALGAGKTIEEAYKLGVVQIRLQGIPEHLTPVLIKKQQ